MKAVRIHAFGDASVLRYEECAAPAIGPNDVLVTMKAAALNHLDVWVRSGQRERDIPLPHIPGSDGAGVIAAAGSEVRHLKAGDRVLISPGLSCRHCAHCLSGRDNLCREYRVLGVREEGTYAEQVALPAVNVLPIPDGLDFHGAAAVPLVFLTAWHMLVTLAKIRPGETVLVHGAGSGVGSAAIQIARLFHARVITTAGTDAKLARAKELGADELINYATNSFTEEVKRLTGKRGVDIVFEHVGGKVLEQSITVLAKGGRLVTCGATTEFSATIDIRYVYSRHQSIFGSWMGSKDELLTVMEFFRGPDPKFRPVIDKVFPLAEAAAAHRRMEERQHFGKIVLSM
jgi:NADPH:quinone reductase-like Zn-dependent oxidoreductase